MNSNTPGALLTYDFTFEKGAMKGWFFNIESGSSNLQSLSTNYSFFAPNDAHDIALHTDTALHAAAVWNEQGTWTISAVPEPESYLMLGAGLAVLLAARRKQKQFIAKQ